MKKFIKNTIVVTVITGAILATSASPASAINGSFRVATWSDTCITMYDHIDQYGNPYGTKSVKCPGQSFSTATDWDMAVWPNGYCLKYAGVEAGIFVSGTTCPTLNRKKFSDGASIEFGTVKK